MTNTAIDVENMDFSVKPGESFYRYTNGGWLAKNTIPSDRSSLNSFVILDELSKANLKEMFSGLVKEPVGSSLIAEMYLSAMDTDAIEKAGIEPLQDLLNEINSIQSLEDFSRISGLLYINGVGSNFWDAGTESDMKNSNMNILYLGQSGLGLPDREYYFDESKKEICEKYVAFIKNMFVLAGEVETVAEGQAKDVFELEKSVAHFALKREELRDPEKTYNKLSISQLKEAAPSIAWDSFFKVMNIEDPGNVIVHNVPYFQSVNGVLEKADISSLKSYLRIKALNRAAPYLHDAFVQEHFKFNETVLRGTQEIKPRWKRAIDLVSNELGDLVGKQYVEKYFSKEAKDAAVEMIQYIIKSFETRLKTSEWMQEETKKRALHKLSKFVVKVGYPDKWKDYSPLEGKISRSAPFLSNVRLSTAHVHNLEIVQNNKPIDRSKWYMDPYMINAYFHPMRNEIVFPAAILQPPFFYAPTKENPLGQPAMSFGSIGAVIAHELSHGYDDQGRQYDADGNLADWWLPEDSKNFDQRAEKIINQFNKFEILKKNVNGKLTQGENIADLGGVVVSFAAFKEFLKVNGSKLPVDHRFTQEQQFFLAWAQGWRGLMKDEAMLERLVMDPHSPGEFRVDGPLANIPEFHAAFDIKEGERMYVPEDERVTIW
ncbi:endopeptidase [Globomyces pollinis-pini]|nr:endopeptidase [Globomyces pollinis-pini]